MKIFIILLTLSCQLSARIGETKQQCIERYGEIVSESEMWHHTIFFKKDAYEISIALNNDGKVDRIVYTKPTKNSAGVETNDDIPLSEIKLLLKANAPDIKWTILNEEGYIFFRTPDNSISAMYHKSDSHLLISTREYKERTEKIKSSEEKKKMEGF